MTEEEKLDTVTTSEGEALRAETVEAAPEVADRDRTAQLEAELAEAKAAVLYAHAEAQNVRRRAEKEAIDARAYAVTGFARDILSVADNLERGLAAIPEELRGDDRMKGLITGLEATKRDLDSVFQRNGITRIAAMGMPLDPNQHQAMLEMPSDKAPGTIVQEMQAGYMLKDRLLRPSMVAVAKKPE
jgi:molecular chaperone GrpE